MISRTGYNTSLQNKSNKSSTLNGNTGGKIAFKGGIQDKIATGIANAIPARVFTNKFTQQIFKIAKKDLALFDALLTAGIVCSVRPATIMTMPGAKEDDKQYAATKAIAGGLIGLGITALTFTPLNKAFRTVAQKFFNKEGSKTFQYMLNYGSRFIVAPIQAFLLVELMHPIMDLVFPKKKSKEHDEKHEKHENHHEDHEDHEKDHKKPEHFCSSSFLSPGNRQEAVKK